MDFFAVDCGVVVVAGVCGVAATAAVAVSMVAPSAAAIKRVFIFCAVFYGPATTGAFSRRNLPLRTTEVYRLGIF